jgi:predicted ribosome quality control (RQC) complex YloA/Tae2 family protein
VRIIKSNNEIRLPDGIEKCHAFTELVNIYNDSSLQAKKISIKNLMTAKENFESEKERLTKKIEELEEEVKNVKREAALEKAKASENKDLLGFAKTLE